MKSIKSAQLLHKALILLSLMTITLHQEDGAYCSTFCQNDPYSTTVTTFSCGCKPNYVWSATNLKCVRDCKRIANANLTGVVSDPNSCACKGTLYWNATNSTCVLDCSTILYTTSNSSFGTASSPYCKCQANTTNSEGTTVRLIWGNTNFRCEVACPSVGVLKTGLSEDPTQCVCLNKYFWNQTSLLCQISCEEIGNTTTGTIWSPTKCTCRKNFVWSSSLLTCTLTCSLDPYYQSTSQKLTNGNCLCKTNYYWDNQTEFACLANCTGVFQST